MTQLNAIAQKLVEPGKGILAADESEPTIAKRFDKIGLTSSEELRRDYREMLFRSTEAMTKYVSGVILTEETDWIGGQLTSQAVPPDENPWVETFGATRSYQELRTRIRDYYRRNYPLTAAARAQPYLNPGGGGVSRLCHEPRVALAALNEMLAPFVSAGRVRVLPRHVPVSASTEGDRVESVRVRSLESGRELVLHGPMFVDATETGELLPLTGTEYVTGAEARSETGEPHAAEVAGPQNMQAATLCFPLEYLHGEDFTIDRPEEWEFWRDYVPQLSPPWPGKLFSFVYSHPATLKPRDYGFDAEKGTGFFYYRRIVDRRNFAPGIVISSRRIT